MSLPQSILRVRRQGTADEEPFLFEFSELNTEPKVTPGSSPEKDSSIGCSVLLDESDLECSLCLRLLYDPVTTPCGHTYCKTCLLKCLEFGSNCPLCRHFLCSRSQDLQLACNFTLISILKKNFPVEYKQRAEEDKIEGAEFKKEKKGPEAVDSSPLADENQRKLIAFGVYYVMCEYYGSSFSARWSNKNDERRNVLTMSALFIALSLHIPFGYMFSYGIKTQFVILRNCRRHMLYCHCLHNCLDNCRCVFMPYLPFSLLTEHQTGNVHSETIVC